MQLSCICQVVTQKLMYTTPTIGVLVFTSFWHIFHGIEIIVSVLLCECIFLRHMIELVLGFLARCIISSINTAGYAGVFVLMFIESCGVPAPSEVSMPFAGYLVSTGRFNFWFVVLAGTLGNVLGSLLAYWIGARGGRPLLERYGKYVGISARHLDAADGWFKKHGEVAVFGGRLLPVVRTYISFPAGAARMNLKKFIVYTTLGVFPWALLFTWLGIKLAAEWDQIHERLQFLNIIVVVGILGVVAYLWYRHANKK